MPPRAASSAIDTSLADKAKCMAKGSQHTERREEQRRQHGKQPGKDRQGRRQDEKTGQR